MRRCLEKFAHHRAIPLFVVAAINEFIEIFKYGRTVYVIVRFDMVQMLMISQWLTEVQAQYCRKKIRNANGQEYPLDEPRYRDFSTKRWLECEDTPVLTTLGSVAYGKVTVRHRPANED